MLFLFEGQQVNFFVIVQIVAEKQKFRKTPFNYAQKKNNLMRSKVSKATLYYTYTFVERLCGVTGCFEDSSVFESQLESVWDSRDTCPLPFSDMLDFTVQDNFQQTKFSVGQVFVQCFCFLCLQISQDLDLRI